MWLELEVIDFVHVFVMFFEFHKILCYLEYTPGRIYRI